MSDDLYSRVMSRSRRLLRQSRRIELLRAIEAKDDADRIKYAMERVISRKAIKAVVFGHNPFDLNDGARRVLWITIRLIGLNRKYANHE